MLPYALIGLAILLLVIAVLVPDEKQNPERLFGLNFAKASDKPQTVSTVARIMAAARALSETRPRDRDENESLETLVEVDSNEPTLVTPDPVADTPPAAVRAAECDNVASELPAPIAVTIVESPIASTVTEKTAKTPRAIVDDAAEEADENEPAVQLPPIGRKDRRIIWPRLLDMDVTQLSQTERFGIVLTLGAIGEDHVAPILSEVLDQEEDETIRDAALEAIRDARLEAALHSVELSLTSDRDRERLLAVEALAALGADPQLHAALADPCVAVALAAAAALRRRDDISEEALRKELAQNGDSKKVEQVVEMLATI